MIPAVAARAARAKCVTCAQTVSLRHDGRMKRHKLPGEHRLCWRSGEFPRCPFCREDGTCETVSPSVRVCRVCAGAIARGDIIEKCRAKGCRDGYTLCDEHCKQGEDVCYECGASGPAPRVPCTACEGRGVIYTNGPCAARP